MLDKQTNGPTEGQTDDVMSEIFIKMIYQGSLNIWVTSMDNFYRKDHEYM